MGGNVSVPAPPSTSADVPVKQRVSEILPFVKPLYHTTQPFGPNERETAEKTWKMILNNQCDNFNHAKASSLNFPHANAIEWFYDIFYNRLFDVHPGCKTLFHRSINKQGSFFVRMFSLLISEVEDTEAFTKTLDNMVNLHNKIGVKAFEYALMGEVLLFSLRKVLGSAYTPVAHYGWVKIYSRILDVIMPNVIEFELTHKESAGGILEKRLTSQHHAGPLFTEKTSITVKDTTIREGVKP